MDKKTRQDILSVIRYQITITQDPNTRDALWKLYNSVKETNPTLFERFFARLTVEKLFISIGLLALGFLISYLFSHTIGGLR